MIGAGELDYFSGVQLNDEKDVETFETENVYGKEIAGEQGFPVRTKEPFP
jgi:hypothetical protein